jgi:RecA-family ATPase
MAMPDDWEPDYGPSGDEPSDWEPDAGRPDGRGGAKVIRLEERKSRFYSAASLEGKPVPQREWLVPGLVPMKTVTLFSGDGGTGKSLLALQLSVSVAAGLDWLGRWARPGRAIFMSAEDDDDELHRRLHDILISVGKHWGDLGGLTLRSLAGESALLAVDTQVELYQSTLFDELEDRAEGEQPTLVVIDTLADVYPANENDRAKARQFIGILRGLALRRSCAVMLLGHPSLSGLASGSGSSGSTAWNNSVRSRLYLQRIIENEGYEPDPDRRILSTKKSNYGRVGEEISLTWRGGAFVADETPSSIEEMTSGLKAERVFLALLDRFTEEGRYVSASPSATYAPSLFSNHQDAEGCTKRAFVGAMNTLFARGAIVVAEHAANRQKRSHIVRARQEGSDDSNL